MGFGSHDLAGASISKVTCATAIVVSADGRALYEVEFRFGRLHLHAGQISYLADLGRSEEQLAS